MGTMAIRLTILSELAQVAKEQNVELPQLSNNLVLLESGLSSLVFV